MEALKQNNKRIISFKKARNLLILVVFCLFFDFFLFPLPLIANAVVEEAEISLQYAEITQSENYNTNSIINDHLPENQFLEVKRVVFSTITAYNSEIGQCDDSPCITANGFDVCEHGIEDTIAANFLRFASKVRIPELFGDRIFIVRDRMNERYFNTIDVWMVNKQDAKQFGVKVAKIEILE
ncbi:MAG: hypothetical protein ABH830_02190 [Patescibacteria group bacterium]